MQQTLKFYIGIFASCVTVFANENEPSAPIPSSLSHQSELGIALAGGNSDSKTINAKQRTTYRWNRNTLQFDSRYLYGEAKGKVAARNWNIALKYERGLSHTLGAYIGQGIESDRFVGYDYRLNSDLGAKLYLIPGDKTENYLSSEVGYRYAYESRINEATPSSLNSHYIRIYLEGKKWLNKTVALSLWFEILEDLADTENLGLNFEPALLVQLNQALTLKVSFLGKFDNVPSVSTKDKFDYTFITALVAKF